MMRVLLDACVLYPTVLRRILFGLAEQGIFTPLWSERILEEWRFAGPEVSDALAAMTGADIALSKARWPDAMCSEETRDDLWLPDPDDIHVLAAAINGQADILLTANLKDFPTRVLTGHGLVRRDPDGFLAEIAQENLGAVQNLVTEIFETADVPDDAGLTVAKFVKRARLPRLAKLL